MISESFMIDYVNGYAYHEYEYRMIASMVKIFGDEYGYDIGEYLVSEYSRKNPELLTHGYIDTKNIWKH
jgi:hypothetical protein